MLITLSLVSYPLSYAYFLTRLIMEKIPPAARLGVPAGTLSFSIAALYPVYLRWKRIDSTTKVLRQPQIWITLLKCAFDATLVALFGLQVSSIIDGQ